MGCQNWAGPNLAKDIGWGFFEVSAKNSTCIEGEGARHLPLKLAHKADIQLKPLRRKRFFLLCSRNEQD